MRIEDLLDEIDIPNWAKGSEAYRGFRNKDAKENTWDLYYQDRHIGCMFDNGDGYQFLQWIGTEDLPGAILHD